MSKYTVQLRRVIETFTRDEVKKWFTDWDLSDYLTPKELAVVNNRGTFDKDKLADMILDNYYMTEIGFETVGLFKHYAKLHMRQIMGRYAFIIYSASINFDPLVNEDFTETISRSTDNTGSTTTDSNGSGFGVSSDTPQTNINKTQLLAGSYATNVQADQQESTGTSSGQNHETEAITRSTRGNRGITSNAPYLIREYRDYIINIYGEIIQECRELFMLVY